MLKRMVALCVCIITVFTFCACSSGGKSGDTKRIAIVAPLSQECDFQLNLIKSGLEKFEPGTFEVTFERAENITDAIGLVTANADFVILIGADSQTAQEAAKQNKDTRFIHLGSMDSPPGNLLCVNFVQAEADFICGFIAAKVSKSQKIGALGYDVNATSVRFDNFQKGVLHANQGLTVSRELLGTDAAEKSGIYAAQSLFDQGNDIVFNAYGTAMPGLIESAVETRNFTVGINPPEDYANTYNEYLMNVYVSLDVLIYDIMQTFISDNAFAGGTLQTVDAKSKYFAIQYFENPAEPAVSAEVKNEATQLIASLVEDSTLSTTFGLIVTELG